MDLSAFAFEVLGCFFLWGIVSAVLKRQNLRGLCGMTVLKMKVVFCQYKELEWFRSLGLQAVRKRHSVESMEYFLQSLPHCNSFPCLRNSPHTSVSCHKSTNL